MVRLWVLRGLKKGILSTKYPKMPPTDEEIPVKSLPPVPTESSDWEKGEGICPTGAIQRGQSPQEKNRIDLGRCVYCQRCSKAGFVFSGSDNSLQATFAPATEEEMDLKSSEDKLFQRYAKQWNAFKKSFHILMIDVGSCNACNLEVLNLSNPYYDLNRLGIFFTNSPKHADALIVVGALNKAMVDVLKRTYESIPNPKLVIAVGACPISGGAFQDTVGFASPIKDVIPVDVVVPGCPPSPIQILQGLLIAMGKLKSHKSPNAAKMEPPIAPQIRED